MFDKIRRRGFALDPSCVLWMPFYRMGTEQSRIWDYSFDNLSGAITESTPVGGGWYFDGTDDRVVHASFTLHKLHTMHYWLKRDGDTGIIHGGAADYGVQITDTTVGYTAAAGSIVAVSHNGDGPTSQKTLISVQRVLDKVTFYQDGLLIGTEQTLPVNDNQTLTDVGRYSTPSDYFEGTIYEVAIFDIAQGAVGIRNHFEMTRRIQGI